MRTTFRIALVTATLCTLAACRESGPTAVTGDAAFASGSSSGGGGGGATAVTTEIALTRPADGVYRNAKGKAKFATKASERELQIEIENVPAGTVLTVMLGDVTLGTPTADTFGKARLALNSKRGQAVPMSVAGLTVSVSTSAGPVVSGAF